MRQVIKPTLTMKRGYDQKRRVGCKNKQQQISNHSRKIKMKPLLHEGDKIKLSDPQFKQSANVINAILGALTKGNDTLSHWAVRYLLKHLDRSTLIKLYNEACSHDYATIDKKIAEEPSAPDEGGTGEDDKSPTSKEESVLHETLIREVRRTLKEMTHGEERLSKVSEPLDGYSIAKEAVAFFMANPESEMFEKRHKREQVSIHIKLVANTPTPYADEYGPICGEAYIHGNRKVASVSFVATLNGLRHKSLVDGLAAVIDHEIQHGRQGFTLDKRTKDPVLYRHTRSEMAADAAAVRKCMLRNGWSFNRAVKAVLQPLCGGCTDDLLSDREYMRKLRATMTLDEMTSGSALPGVPAYVKVPQKPKSWIILGRRKRKRNT